MKFKLKHAYICEFCRTKCGGSCNEDLERLKRGIVDKSNADMANNRKQSIKCLGRYCDEPCELQDNNAEVDPQVFVNTIKYLGERLNTILTSQSTNAKAEYTKPSIETHTYKADQGYAATVALHRDHVLVEGNDNSTTRSSEEITDVTDWSGEYTASEWQLESEQ